MVMGIFTVASLALMGTPGLCGFVSKWYLAQAAAESGNPLAFAGVGVLLVSALLTAVYMLTVAVRAWFPPVGFCEDSLAGIKDPGICMLLPIVLFAGVMVLLGLYSMPLTDFLQRVSRGMY